MRIVISGASSFIGMRLVYKASEQGWKVVAVIRDSSIQRKVLNNVRGVSVCTCDMENYSDLGPIVGESDCFVHLSWDGTRGNARLDDQKQYKNYKQSLDAIKSMIDSGCKRIVTAGSQAEYGLSNEIITEDTPCNPNTAYGKYKVKLFEKAYALCEKNKISFKEPRYFSLYGPGDYENTMIMSCIENMLKNEPCKLTQAIQMWDYLYIDDAINALMYLCGKSCADGAYNFGSGDCRPLRDYIEELKQILNSNSKLLYGAIPYSDAGMVSIHPSIKKLVNETGWSPKVNFEEGIKQVLKFRQYANRLQ